MASQDVMGPSQPPAKEAKMESAALTRDVRDCFEYYGHPAVTHLRKRGRRAVWREWVLFDSVDEAREFYHQQTAA